MENTFQTSFIPKKPIILMNNTRRSMPIGVFPILATLILVLTILCSIGLFFYKGYLNKQKESLSISLVSIKDSFEEGTIENLESFEKRINAAKDVLASHVVLTPLFNLLGETTIPSIQYTKFEHEIKENGFYVKIIGISRDYRSIALQADVFNGEKGRYFKNVIFSNLTKNIDNSITFNLEFNVDPSLLSYEKDILINTTEVDSNKLLNNSNLN